MDVTNKIALVTGGGRGIGRGICLALATNGADVAVSDINTGDAQGVTKEVESLRRRSLAVTVDVTGQGSVESMVADVIAQFGRIDILVNNAGIIAAPGWEDRSQSNEDDWDMIYAINVKGVVRVTESVASHMKERRYGKIVNIASGADGRATPVIRLTTFQKAGVIIYTQASAQELAPYNINVNCICPGLLWTPMWVRIATRRGRTREEWRDLPPREVFEKIVEAKVPLGREQTPKTSETSPLFSRRIVRRTSLVRR